MQLLGKTALHTHATALQLGMAIPDQIFNPGFGIDVTGIP
jgi:hypothetical protein